MLSASLVLYETPELQVRRCLASLRANWPEIKVLIVDNSPHGSPEGVFHVASAVEYVHLPSNPGYGAGHNVGLRKALEWGSRYHVVLNADVYFSHGVLKALVDFLDVNPSVGQVMPDVRYPDGSVQRLCKLVPTPLDLITRVLRLDRLRRSSFELHGLSTSLPSFVPYLSGCFMMLRCEALRKVGLFDERFFMYPEDIDLTRRMAEQFDTMYYPGVSIYHEHGAASKKSFRMLCVHAANMIRYFNKWGWFFDHERVVLNRRALQQLERPSTF